MVDRPGFTVRKVELDDDVIELPENPEEDAGELVELRALLDETVDELRENRNAREKLFETVEAQRTELNEARAELRTLRTEAAIRLLGFANLLAAGRRFVPDGRGGELEVTSLADLTGDQGEE